MDANDHSQNVVALLGVEQAKCPEAFNYLLACYVGSTENKR